MHSPPGLPRLRIPAPPQTCISLLSCKPPEPTPWQAPCRHGHGRILPLLRLRIAPYLLRVPIHRYSATVHHAIPTLLLRSRHFVPSSRGLLFYTLPLVRLHIASCLSSTEHGFGDSLVVRCCVPTSVCILGGRRNIQLWFTMLCEQETIPVAVWGSVPGSSSQVSLVIFFRWLWLSSWHADTTCSFFLRCDCTIVWYDCSLRTGVSGWSCACEMLLFWRLGIGSLERWRVIGD
ncbi:hypothetical protein M758_6G071300 [Ceratodon purpureus]|nr:hypothetical protein M758_6G071300 [Ceratodon purpureus]